MQRPLNEIKLDGWPFQYHRKYNNRFHKETFYFEKVTYACKGMYGTYKAKCYIQLKKKFKYPENKR